MAINLVTLTDPASPAAEAYRRLRINLLAAGREALLQTLLVAAAGPGADKSVVVANLAVTFAKIGKRVILADCDLRHPTQHILFGMGNSVGVTTALSSDQPALPLQSTEVPGLRVLASGPSLPISSDLIASPAMADLIARLRNEADVVLFDAPPVTLATDAAELATKVDGVLLTVSASHTRRDDARQAKELLERAGARLIGAALINVAADAALRKYLAMA